MTIQWNHEVERQYQLLLCDLWDEIDKANVVGNAQRANDAAAIVCHFEADYKRLDGDIASAVALIWTTRCRLYDLQGVGRLTVDEMIEMDHVLSKDVER